jgi:hypothetical protein
MTGSNVYTGSGITQGTYTWAKESWDKWNSYMATRTEQDVPIASATGDGLLLVGYDDGSNTGNARKSAIGEGYRWLLIGVVAVMSGLLV